MVDISNGLFQPIIEEDIKIRRFKRRLEEADNRTYNHSSVRLTHLNTSLLDEEIVLEMSMYGPIIKIKRECGGRCAIITFRFIFDAIKLLQSNLTYKHRKDFKPLIEKCERQKVRGVYYD